MGRQSAMLDTHPLHSLNFGGLTEKTREAVDGVMTTVVGGDNPMTSIMRTSPTLQINPAAMGMAVVGGAAGAFLWKKHPVLGGALGLVVGRNAKALMEPAQRKAALGDVACTGVGVLAAKHWKKHPILAFLGGVMAACLVKNKVGL